MRGGGGWHCLLLFHKIACFIILMSFFQKKVPKKTSFPCVHIPKLCNCCCNLYKYAECCTYSDINDQIEEIPKRGIPSTFKVAWTPLHPNYVHMCISLPICSRQDQRNSQTRHFKSFIQNFSKEHNYIMSAVFAARFRKTKVSSFEGIFKESSFFKSKNFSYIKSAMVIGST